MDDLLDHVRSTFAGTYNVERELTGGGMSRLFIATDVALSRPVVIKILPPELTSDVMAARFRRESEITAHLQHPHVLPIITAGLRDGLMYYVMPFIAGESLRMRLDREGALLVPEAIRILREVASALAYAHERGVIHRDIKPENILLQADHAVLADFGISAALTQGAPDGAAVARERITRTGMSLGTVGYMAPEQALGSNNVDARADVYALGVVAYEMLAGEPPFTGANPQAVLAAHITQKPPRLDRVRGDVSSATAVAIQRAMAKNPEERFQTAAEFAEAIDGPTARRWTPGSLPIPGLRALTGARSGGRSTQRTAGTRTTYAPPTRRASRIVVPTVILVAVLAGLGLWYRHEHAVIAPGDVVTVLVAPFDDLVDDSQLWHEGMVDLMARNLDGAGALRTVSPELALRRWNPRNKSDRAPAVSLARSTGAQYTVFGHLIPTDSDRVHLQASLVDVATDSTLVEYDARGPTVEQLADSLTLAVLQALRDRRRLGAVRLTSIGSSSPRAVKAFLQGEQYYRRTAWDSAAAAYARAYSIDTNFAIAMRRAATVTGWQRDVSDSAARVLALRAGAKNHGLGLRDSLFLAADSMTAALSTNTFEPRDWRLVRRLFATVAGLTQHYPDDPEAWYELGEARYHQGYGEPLDVTDRQILEAFERSIDLDPRFAPAYIHPVELALTLDGRTAARRFVDAYLATNPRDRYADGIRLIARLTDSTARPIGTDAHALDTLSSDVIWSAWFAIRRWPDSGETALELLRALARRPRTAPTYAQDSARLYGYLPLQLAYDGRLRESYLTLGNRVSKLLPELTLLGVIAPDTASRVFGSWLEEHKSQAESALPWWAQRGDTTALRAYVQSADAVLASSRSASQRRLATYDTHAGRAYLSLARHDTTRALTEFATLSDTLCLSCYLDRLTAAKILAARGRYDDADRLLRQRLYTLLTPVELLIAMERARVAERRGDRVEALRGYQRVATAWSIGDREVQPFVREADARMAALRGARAIQDRGTGNAGRRATLAVATPLR